MLDPETKKIKRGLSSTETMSDTATGSTPDDVRASYKASKAAMQVKRRVEERSKQVRVSCNVVPGGASQYCEDDDSLLAELWAATC